MSATPVPEAGIDCIIARHAGSDRATAAVLPDPGDCPECQRREVRAYRHHSVRRCRDCGHTAVLVTSRLTAGLPWWCHGCWGRKKPAEAAVTD